jgi:hypothetical protein
MKCLSPELLYVFFLSCPLSIDKRELVPSLSITLKSTPLSSPASISDETVT